MLKYPPFAAVAAIAQVAKGGSPLKQGQGGPQIAVLQGALIDLGFKLPKSTRKHGVPDGVFGHETFTVLQRFQAKNGLKDDGIAGKKTIEALDKLLAAKASKTAPVKPQPPVQPPAPRTAHYELGTGDPPLGADPGAGKWNSKPTEAVYLALKASIISILPQAVTLIGDDAVKHMAHYLGNTGRTFTIDLEDMIEEVPSARENLEIEAAQAQEFAEMLGPGKYKIRSRGAEGGYNEKKENWNWFFAIGGYSSWGAGELTVKDGPGGRTYDLDFEYEFFDRYNWDKGKKVTIFNITVTDEFMGEFHRQGIAREYDCVGSVKRKLSWKHGEAIPKEQFRRKGFRS